jgi:hypothetical protein
MDSNKLVRLIKLSNEVLKNKNIDSTESMLNKVNYHQNKYDDIRNKLNEIDKKLRKL